MVLELLSWNVNGIRACISKGSFLPWVTQRKPDILAIQETKAQPDQLSLAFDLPDYELYWHSAEKKGYSGVLTLSRNKPLSTVTKTGHTILDTEGRFLQLEFDNFFLINLYFPNAQRELKRIEYKQEFNQTLLKYTEKLKRKKSVVLCGDFNVAHKEIDLKNPKTNQKNAGFSPTERAFFTELLDHGYIDTFRMFNQDPDHYSWWTYRSNARERNIGWRIDYFVVTEDLKSNIQDAFILPEVHGSDHAPVGLKLTF
ncbi:MAG: exodeoxyribonuclease III [Candidatus Hodarchaeales archaeon]|jgi:exodeoxyribonuclease-3